MQQLMVFKASFKNQVILIILILLGLEMSFQIKSNTPDIEIRLIIYSAITLGIYLSFVFRKISRVTIDPERKALKLIVRKGIRNEIREAKFEELKFDLNEIRGARGATHKVLTCYLSNEEIKIWGEKNGWTNRQVEEIFSVLSGSQTSEVNSTKE